MSRKPHPSNYPTISDDVITITSLTWIVVLVNPDTVPVHGNRFGSGRHNTCTDDVPFHTMTCMRARTCMRNSL